MMGATTGSFGASVALIVSINPGTAYKTINGGGDVTTNQVTASVANGVGPYSFVWTYVSGDNDFSTNFSNPSAIQSWSNNLNLNQYKSATWQVTATDSVGNTGSKTLTVNVYDVSYEGGAIP